MLLRDLSATGPKQGLKTHVFANTLYHGAEMFKNLPQNARDEILTALLEGYKRTIDDPRESKRAALKAELENHFNRVRPKSDQNS